MRNDNTTWAIDYITTDSTTDDYKQVTWNDANITITGPAPSSAMVHGDISFSWDTAPIADCLVCNKTQEHQICEVCAIAVKEYRNQAFLQQIKDLL